MSIKYQLLGQLTPLILDSKTGDDENCEALLLAPLAVHPSTTDIIIIIEELIIIYNARCYAVQYGNYPVLLDLYEILIPMARHWSVVDGSVLSSIRVLDLFNLFFHNKINPINYNES